MNAIVQIDPTSPALLNARLHRSTVLVPTTEPPPRFWTAREVKVLHETYPVSGIMLSAANLPGRTIGAIFQRAKKEGLRSSRPKPVRWPATPQIDDVIRRTYQGTPYPGMLRDLAGKLSRPEAWVQARALRLGLVVPRFKELPWSSREIQIVAEKRTLELGSIRRALKKEGFTRTKSAIFSKMRRLHLSQVDEEREDYSARGLAEVMGVNPKTITSWIERGLLKASGLKASRSQTAPVTEYHIQPSDVRRFLINNVAVYDVRKVDKFWFVDLIADPANSFRKTSTPALRDHGEGGGR